ncbi:MAG: hypothetical protein WC414_01650 [Patescibacteria group bacterium]
MSKLKIEEFFVEGKNPQKSHVLIHIAEPTTPEEEKRGYFFALAEIKNNNPVQISNLQSIIDEIEEKYYAEGIKEETLETIFEEIIQTINKKSSVVLNDENSEINCLVATLRGNKIIFAYQGYPKVSLFFIKDDNTSEIKIIDAPAYSNNQLFCSVIDGNINPGDIIFLYTPSTENFLDLEKIKFLIKEKKLSEINSFLQKTLEILDNDDSYGGIFIKKTREESNAEKIDNSKIEKIGSQESLKTLSDTQENTTAVLSPTIMNSLNKKIKSFKDKEKKQEIKTIKHGAIETNFRNYQKSEDKINKFLISFGKFLVLTTKKFYSFGQTIIQKIFNFFINIFLITSNKNGHRTLILDRYQTKIQQKKSSLKNLGILPKVFFISILILIIIFIANVFYLKHKDKKEAEQAQYDNTVVLIEEKIDDAEAKLLYGEEAQTYEILKKANETLNSLNINKPERIEEQKKLKEKIDNLLTQLRKITIVHPEMLLEISDNEKQIDTQKIIFYDETKIIVYGEKNDNLYIVNPITKTIEIKNHETYSGFKNAKLDQENSLIYFLYKDNKIVEYNIKTNSFNSKDVFYPNENTNITAFDIYNGKLYSFDINHNQIYKHNQTQTGFEKGTSWIIDNEKILEDIISMSIDSNIFLLGKNQNVYKFNKGKEYLFELTGIDPVIEQATKIWTDYESDYIYILDGKNKRIIIIDKEGHFISQYLSEEWTEPTDMAIDETKKNIWILDKNKLYKFNFSK